MSLRPNIDNIVARLGHPPADDESIKAGGSPNPHRLYNIGNHKSERLDRLIDLVEAACGQPAIRINPPMQAGDMAEPFADISAIQHDLGFTPSVGIDVGVPRLVEWYGATRTRNRLNKSRIAKSRRRTARRASS